MNKILNLYACRFNGDFVLVLLNFEQNLVEIVKIIGFFDEKAYESWGKS